MIHKNKKEDKMRVSVEYGSYNTRRYGKPWIAKITAWPVGGKPELEWGAYCGDDDGGECEIESQAGDIIRSGQRDGRGNGGSNDWYIVEANGSLTCVDQPEARKAWEARQVKPVLAAIDLSTVPDADLIAEVTRRGLTA
jgi:hypothetical protein